MTDHAPVKPTKHQIGRVFVRTLSKAWDDSIFRTALGNTFVYTFWATIFKLALGMWLALLLSRHFRGKRLVRASMLLPFIVPTVLSTFAWGGVILGPRKLDHKLGLIEINVP